MLKNQSLTIAAILIAGVFGLFLFFDPLGVSLDVPSHVSVTHTVLFQFSKDASPDAIQEACGRMIALKDACVNPSTQKPYIVSLRGGKDNSAEGKQGGATHGFVVEFASTADRDYYIQHDPAHQTFVQSASDIVQNAIVVDFENGLF
ncbi:putative stress responsive a b barrel domain-containing protein [Phaeoacremonium minimum UCRPA7]|uniref:Putative stress responsive a b barrel domain-containing protein n=1 Tax=Phaeoacremonium minimum (strain UCR-PA7) TaxID=1286976 RepID=R8BU49_PHAM7|nr:putative stress responsive a b barrel domain-containing protein [Phaeoacremonium minimum UCRPA7]EOO02886.1 putative stress responsive a b barrel domain-containing protein [Phaeoacremonium minimum UCRPA7]